MGQRVSAGRHQEQAAGALRSCVLCARAAHARVHACKVAAHECCRGRHSCLPAAAAPAPANRPVQAQPASASPFSGTWQCAAESWRSEGAAVFVRGLGPTMARGFIVNAAIFCAFEALMQAMAEH